MARSTRFLDACARRPTDCTPVWLMRQAGRYQSSYRAIRERVSFFDLCATAELAAQVTVNAVEELGVDAAIIFSDILVPVRAMGAPVELTEAGPRLEAPVRDAAAVDRLRVVDPLQEMPSVFEAIKLTRRALAGAVPVIGFAGAPLTLAAYLVEGGHSKDYSQLKRLLFCAPDVAQRLLRKLAEMVAVHLRAQVEAGCAAVQLFDSWAGVLSPADYRELALPHCQYIFDELERCNVPRIFFGTDTAMLLEQLAETRAEVIGLDWRIELDEGWRRIGDRAVQGNLDPTYLFMNEPELERRVARILGQAAGRPGHIFNLGHGVLPTTDPQRARFLVDTVHRLSARSG